VCFCAGIFGALVSRADRSDQRLGGWDVYERLSGRFFIFHYLRRLYLQHFRKSSERVVFTKVHNQHTIDEFVAPNHPRPTVFYTFPQLPHPVRLSNTTSLAQALEAHLLESFIPRSPLLASWTAQLYTKHVRTRITVRCLCAVWPRRSWEYA
jgi:hypothetical protein